MATRLFHRTSCARTHVLHAQVLHHKLRVGIAEPGRILVQEVLPRIGNASLDAGDAKTRPLPATTAPEGACIFALRPGQQRLQPPEAVQRFNEGAVRERGESSDTHVHTSHRSGWMDRIRHLSLAANGHVPFASPLEDRDVARGAYHRARFEETYPSDLRKLHSASVEGEARREPEGLTAAATLLEARRTSTFRNTLLPCSIEVTQRLLERTGRRFIEPRKGVTLPMGEERGHLHVKDGWLSFRVCPFLEGEGRVPHEAVAPGDAPEQRRLPRLRLEPVHIALDLLHGLQVLKDLLERLRLWCGELFVQQPPLVHAEQEPEQPGDRTGKAVARWGLTEDHVQTFKGWAAADEIHVGKPVAFVGSSARPVSLAQARRDPVEEAEELATQGIHCEGTLGCVQSLKAAFGIDASEKGDRNVGEVERVVGRMMPAAHEPEERHGHLLPGIEAGCVAASGGQGPVGSGRGTWVTDEWQVRIAGGDGGGGAFHYGTSLWQSVELPPSAKKKAGSFNTAHKCGPHAFPLRVLYGAWTPGQR